jgi:hypothetical protein
VPINARAARELFPAPTAKSLVTQTASVCHVHQLVGRNPLHESEFE